MIMKECKLMSLMLIASCVIILSQISHAETCLLPDDKSVCEHEEGSDVSSFLQVTTLSSTDSSTKSLQRAVNAHRVHQVPQYVVDLDLPPRQRFKEIARDFRDFITDSWDEEFQNESYWLQNVRFSANETKQHEYMEELQGIVEEVNHPGVTLELLIMRHLVYERGLQEMCGAVLVALPNGTVILGRNTDVATFLIDVTLEYTMVKNGKPFIKVVGFPGNIGFTTAMRLGDWSVAQNARFVPDSPQQSFEATNNNLEALKMGGMPFLTVVREIMEAEPDFQAAVDKLSAAKFMAPSYFSLAGSGADQGAVLTIDRLSTRVKGTPPTKYLTKKPGISHLVQTNSDMLSPDWDWSHRRDLTNELLDTAGVTNAFAGDNPQLEMMRLLHTPPLMTDITDFSTVMVPATGYFETTLPSEGPEALGINMSTMLQACQGC